MLKRTQALPALLISLDSSAAFEGYFKISGADNDEPHMVYRGLALKIRVLAHESNYMSASSSVIFRSVIAPSSLQPLLIAKSRHL